MINKENLTKQQVERLEELNTEISMDMWDWFKNEQPAYDQELYSEICELGIEMVSLLKLYKEQLGTEGKLPLSNFREEIENLNIVADSVQQAIIDFMPEGTTILKQFFSIDED